MKTLAYLVIVIDESKEPQHSIAIPWPNMLTAAHSPPTTTQTPLSNLSTVWIDFICWRFHRLASRWAIHDTDSTSQSWSKSSVTSRCSILKIFQMVTFMCLICWCQYAHWAVTINNLQMTLLSDTSAVLKEDVRPQYQYSYAFYSVNQSKIT